MIKYNKTSITKNTTDFVFWIIYDDVDQKYLLLPRPPHGLHHLRLALPKYPPAVAHYHQQFGVYGIAAHILFRKHNSTEIEQLSYFGLSLLE